MPGVLQHNSKVAEFLISAFQQIFDLGALEIAQRFADELFDGMGGGMRIAMCTAQWLGDDGVDHAKLFQILAGELQ